MARLSSLTPRDARERSVIDVWRAGWLRPATITVYLGWIRRWRGYWRDRCTDELPHLTRAGVDEIMSKLIGPRLQRQISATSRAVARNSLHAWSCALRILGEPVPRWRPPSAPIPRAALVRAYCDYRRTERGVAASTLVRDAAIATDFLSMLRARHRRIGAVRVVDVDRFVDDMLARLSRSTVAYACSSLRAFLRYLRVTGRMRRDLTTAVIGPRVHIAARPPRALPWTEVRRILRAVPRRRPVDVRDYAMLLLMASYGLGSMEVARLQLDDIDWPGSMIRVRRAKTAVTIELPLLPGVARALAGYLRRGRPAHASAREVFVTMGLPHAPITSAAVRHQVKKYADLAGVAIQGSHAFRHSHATRQIDLGASPKIVSDILGHRRPSSTSVYVRVALRRLRSLALPVPR